MLLLATPCFVDTVPNPELRGCHCSPSLSSELLPLWSSTFMTPYSQSLAYYSNSKFLLERNICPNAFKTLAYNFFKKKKKNLDNLASTVCFFSVIAPQSKVELNTSGRQRVPQCLWFIQRSRLRQSHLLQRTA